MRRLPPRIHPDLCTLLDSVETVRDVIATYGSPVHVVVPEVFRQNVRAFREVLQNKVGDHRICFAHKANQSPLFVEAASAEGIMLEVSSPAEWAGALGAGLDPRQVVVGGPKGGSFLDLVVGTGAVVNVDNLWELDEVIHRARHRGQDGTGNHHDGVGVGAAPVPILLRLSGFGGSSGRPSRFGIPPAAVDHALRRLVAADGAVQFLGPSFHLDSNAVGDKVAAVTACLQAVEQAAAVGLSPSVIDIGGGYGQVFLADLGAYEDYVAALRRGLLGEGPPMTWDGARLGYRVEAGAISGVPTFHRYANAITGPAFLEAILTSALAAHGGRSVADVVSDNLLSLWIEPGRALVDQAGITLSTVQFTTTATDGSTLVTLDLSRDKVCPVDQEVMVDPVVIPTAGPPPASGPASRRGSVGAVGVYLAGSLCLERDLVYQHLTELAWLPRPGDVVAFVNTAAYQMDLSASFALMHPRPPKVGYHAVTGTFVAGGA